jgi:hypothetical protein
MSKEANKTAKKVTIKQVSLKIDLKKDFSETLEITRTLFKDKISKTSIIESALCCASAQNKSFTCTQLATFVIKNLNVKDCFHKRESNKSNDVLKSTILRVRHHVVDTLRTHHKADKLYSYIKSSDSVEFTDKYQAFCKSDKLYRRRVSALLAKIKLQYKAAKKSTVKKSTVKNVNQSIDIAALKALSKVA